MTYSKKDHKKDGPSSEDHLSESSTTKAEKDSTTSQRYHSDLPWTSMEFKAMFSNWSDATRVGFEQWQKQCSQIYQQSLPMYHTSLKRAQATVAPLTEFLYTLSSSWTPMLPSRNQKIPRRTEPRISGLKRSDRVEQ